MQTFPIYINNRDRLTWTRQLAEQCSRLQLVRCVTIIDNASTYPPLLEWYEDCPFEVIRLDENRGPRAPWTVLDPSTCYVVTDSDLDISPVPRHMLEVLHYGLLKHPNKLKVGLSLEIEDIPDVYPLKANVLELETRMWAPYLKDSWFYDANIDTTFAMYRPGTGWGGYDALRTRRPYTARHLPWYVAEGAETEEDRYYLEHLSTEGIVYSAIHKYHREGSLPHGNP